MTCRRRKAENISGVKSCHIASPWQRSDLSVRSRARLSHRLVEGALTRLSLNAIRKRAKQRANDWIILCFPDDY